MKKIWSDILIVLILAWGAVLPLFCWNHNFPVDWANHLWMIAYQGEYLWNTGELAPVINSSPFVGLAYPIFYAPLLYPVLGFFSGALSANTVMRVFLLAILLIKALVLWKGLEKIRLKWWTRFAIAMLLMTSTYALTNLFNRGALTEFIGAEVLSLGVFSILFFGDLWSKRFNFFGSLFVSICLTLIAGTHSITFFFSVLILGTLWLHLLVKAQGFRTALVHLFGVGSVVLLSVSHWIYALSEFWGRLFINKTSENIFQFPKDIDHILTRLMPIPYDARVDLIKDPDLSKISTPYLDSQINVGLLIVLITVLFQIFRGQRDKPVLKDKVIHLGVLLFLSSFVLSLKTPIWDFLPTPFHIVQFGYRFITYINLGLIIALIRIGTRGALSQLESTKIFKGGLILSVILTILSIGLKQVRGLTIVHPIQTQSPVWASQGESLTTPPPNFYGYYGYAVLEGEREINLEKLSQVGGKRGDAFFKVSVGERFGFVEPIEISVPPRHLVFTNVSVFPWNQIYLDGQRVGWDDIFYSDTRAVLEVAPGAHRLEYRFVAPDLWYFLRWVAWFFFFAQLLIFVGFIFRFKKNLWIGP
ncbi:MAG: hypothetical protein IT289_00240 [Oligoflexia bacterium]|nr:hypothetical protein [Oligoflexia bacterium]